MSYCGVFTARISLKIGVFKHPTRLARLCTHSHNVHEQENVADVTSGDPKFPNVSEHTNVQCVMCKKQINSTMS
jgi:hypothetical protein